MKQSNNKELKDRRSNWKLPTSRKSIFNRQKSTHLYIVSLQWKGSKRFLHIQRYIIFKWLLWSAHEGLSSLGFIDKHDTVDSSDSKIAMFMYFDHVMCYKAEHAPLLHRLLLHVTDLTLSLQVMPCHELQYWLLNCCCLKPCFHKKHPRKSLQGLLIRKKGSHLSFNGRTIYGASK